MSVSESCETIRGNIEHYERLLKVESRHYTRENVGKLLGEAKAALLRAQAQALKTP